MALTRSYLKSMGLTEEQISGIVESHSETVDALKKQINALQETEKSFQDVQKELNDLKANGGSFEQRYNDEHAAYEAYKKQIEAEKLNGRKSAALNDLLKESGIARDSVRQLIEKSYDLSKIDFDENGAIKDHDSMLNTLKTDYADFIGTEGNSGVPKQQPPVGGSGSALTVDQIRKMSAEEINKNWAEVSKTLAEK